MTPMPPACDCEDCLDSERPCHHDCDPPSWDTRTCRACRENYDARLDAQFDIDAARGIR